MRKQTWIAPGIDPVRRWKAIRDWKCSKLKSGLDTTAETKGFNGRQGPSITHAIILHLIIDNRRFLNQTFLLVDLGQHDMIIGRRWLAEQDVWMDVRNRRLIWPNECVPTDDRRKQLEESFQSDTVLRSYAIMMLQKFHVIANRSETFWNYLCVFPIMFLLII